MKIKLNQINFRLLFGDVLNLVIAFFVTLFWIPITSQQPIEKYGPLYIYFSITWILVAVCFGRYFRKLRNEKYFVAIFRLFYGTAISYVIFWAYIFFTNNTYSSLVLLAIVLTFFCTLFAAESLFFAIIYASDPDDLPIYVERKEAKTVLNPPTTISEEAFELQKKPIFDLVGERAFDFISKNADLRSSNTYMLCTNEIFNFENILPYRYDVIVNVRRLNNVRGINKMFSTINNKLPDNGIIIGCFKDKSTKKKEILDKYPKVINWIVYSVYYFVKRVVPKLFITKRLYYDITKGKRRVLSKTEVYGRLYYCGFEVLNEKKCNQYTYFVARRIKEPPMQMKRRYGPIISLNRVGKGGKRFQFYKMRTMYPYSEFLQEYIFKKCSLREGGKFNHDIRVSSTGKLFRRYWIDELPMFINLLKGDMKFVGVRPLSKQYFSLYCNELQELRTKFKPGLFPPFYADMPKTLDDIQASEMKYLRMCEKKGSFITDIIYLWKIFVNIVFKRARSK